MSDDDTKLVRTLAPEEFPAEPAKLIFEWRAQFGDRAQAEIRQKVLDALRAKKLEGTPSIAVVARPGRSLADETVGVAIWDGSGNRLCSMTIDDNGFGKLYVLT